MQARQKARETLPTAVFRTQRLVAVLQHAKVEKCSFIRCMGAGHSGARGRARGHAHVSPAQSRMHMRHKTVA